MYFRKFGWKKDTRHSSLEFVAKSWQIFIKTSQNICKIRRRKWKIENSLLIRETMLTIFGWIFEIEERCKGVHCVDLGESFPTSIYLQKSASIQPRTSPPKICKHSPSESRDGTLRDAHIREARADFDVRLETLFLLDSNLLFTIGIKDTIE